MFAMNAARVLGTTVSKKEKSTEKLSTGYKISRAADNAAGLAISEKMRRQIRGLSRGSTNSEDGISMVQTAEGALNEVHDMLHRMNELAVQAANGTNSESDRQAIQDEISQITTEIDRVSETTKFNEEYLLKGGTGTYNKRIWAHDAGLSGVLVQGQTTAIFQMDRLHDSDNIMVGLVRYTVGTGKADVQSIINDPTTGAVGGDTVTVEKGEINPTTGVWQTDHTEVYHVIEPEAEDEADPQQVSFIAGTLKNYNETGATHTVSIGPSDTIEKYELFDGEYHAETKGNVLYRYNNHSSVTDSARIKEVTINSDTYTLWDGTNKDYQATHASDVTDAFTNSLSATNTDVTLGEGGTTYHVLKSTATKAYADSITGGKTVSINGGANAGTWVFDSSGNLTSVDRTGTIQTVNSSTNVYNNINDAVNRMIDGITKDIEGTDGAGGVLNNLKSSLSDNSAYDPDNALIGITGWSPNASFEYTIDNNGEPGDPSATTPVSGSTRTVTYTDTGKATLQRSYTATINGVNKTFTYTQTVTVKRLSTQKQVYKDDGSGSFVWTNTDDPRSAYTYKDASKESGSGLPDKSTYLTDISSSLTEGVTASYPYPDYDSSSATSYYVSSKTLSGLLNEAATNSASTVNIAVGTVDKTFTNKTTVENALSAYNTNGHLIQINNGKYSVQANDHNDVRSLINSATVGAYADATTTVKLTSVTPSASMSYKLRNYNYASVKGMIEGFESRYKAVTDGGGTVVNGTKINVDDTLYTAETEHYRQRICTAYGEDQQTDVTAPRADVDDLFQGGDRVTFRGKTYMLMTDKDNDGYDDKNDHVVTEGRAYKIIAKELEKASSIGCDVADAIVRDKDNADIDDNTTQAAEFLMDVTNDFSKVLFHIERGMAAVQKEKFINVHAGTDADQNNKIMIDISSMSAAGLGIKDLNVVGPTGLNATYAIDAIETAIMEVSRQRSELGAYQNRMEHTIRNLDNVVENTQASETRIRDTDVAEEMVRYSAADIISQASQAMLAQANQSTQGVMTLLG